ncbi:hypothetical protein [Streptomyces sp. NPDC054765]
MTARIRRDRLDLAVRILGGALTGPPRTGDGEHGDAGHGEHAEAGNRGDADAEAGNGQGPEADSGNGWAVIELAYPVLGAVRQLLQFGDSLEVLGPPEARRVMAEAAAAVTAVYAADTPHA